LTQAYAASQGASIGTPMVPEGNIHSKSLRVFPAEVTKTTISVLHIQVEILFESK
jgi:hypothetical protein